MATHDPRTPPPTPSRQPRGSEAPPIRPAHGGNGRSLTGHISDLTTETVSLLRQEISLAKAETRESLQEAKRGAAELAIGGAFLTGGLLVLMAAAVLVVGLVLPLWASALIVGGVAAAAGAGLLAKGKDDISPKNFKPKRTIAELQSDRRMVKEHL